MSHENPSPEPCASSVDTDSSETLITAENLALEWRIFFSETRRLAAIARERAVIREASQQAKTVKAA